MKKIYLSLIALLLCFSLPAQRTTQTIVADVLAQMPTKNKVDFEKQIGDLASTGEEGILMIIKMMNPPGQGSNAQLDFAISGLSTYVSEKGRENQRLTTANAYIKALDVMDDLEIKKFVISQLQIVGKDESIDALAQYLNQEELSGSASRALAAIGTEKAGKALLASLLRRMGTPKTQRDAILAIGEARFADAEDLIGSLIGNGDENFQKDVLYTLSRIGSEASLKKMETLAGKANFTTEKTGANEAYIVLLKRMADQGNTKEAEKAASDLLKNAAQAGQTHTRNAALEIILSIQKEKGFDLVKSALKDSSKEYRNAALDYTSSFANDKIYTELIKTMQKVNPEVKTDILNWIGRENQCPDKNKILKNLKISSKLSASQAIAEQLKDKNTDVKEAAVWTLVKIGDSSAIPVLTNLLKSQDEQMIRLSRSALTSFNGNIAPSVAEIIPNASDAGKIAGLQLLASRKSSDYMDAVLNLTKSDSPEVRNAAYTTLKDVVSEKDFELLCEMLESADSSAVPSLQNAIISSLVSKSKTEQVSLISTQMARASSNKKSLYYVILAETGDRAALATVINGFKQGTGADKEAAFEALTNWKNRDVADELFNICKDPGSSVYFDRAMNSYLKLVSDPALTGENRLLFLRKAMEIAKTDQQKNRILEQIGRTGTFLAMLYAGEFLNGTSVRQTAANAVMNIALAHKEYTGTNVRELLAKVSGILDNPDADYQREAIKKHLNEMPEEIGFVSLFNGKNLTGWKGLVGNPISRAAMKPAELKKAQEKADDQMRADWKVENGLLVFDGTGYDNICTEKQYADFEMYVDWMLDPAGPEPDAGIYLRGTPQVQMWDTARVNVGAQVGSGGLYNNQKHESKPLKVADNKLGEWNTMYIKMTGDRVTVCLNGELVTDNVILENYWNRSLPIPPIEQIELQAHGSKVYYRNIYVKELQRPEPFALSAQEKKEGYKILFDGTNMYEWVGNTVDYTLQDGTITLIPSQGSGGNLYTKDEYGNFIFRFEFMLTPGANNGLGIRTPMDGDPAYTGMELQILDNEDPIYKDLVDYQYHASVYGIIPAKRGYLKPIGEWNYQEVIANGDHIKITLNGTVILDGNIRDAVKNGTPDKQDHPGLFNKKGHIGFLGHGSEVKFRNIRVREL